MEQTITAIQLFDQGLSKAAIKSMAEEAIMSVLDRGNVLQVAEALAAMDLFIKEVKADQQFKDFTREETAKYPKGFISASGAKIECAEVGTKYNFVNCNDTVLERLEVDFFTSENKLKERKEFLKKVPIEGMNMLDTLTGEMVTVYPPSKSSESSFKVTLSK